MSVPASDQAVIRPMVYADILSVLDLERRLFPHDAWPEAFFWDELASSSANPDLPGHALTRRYWVAAEPERTPGAGETILGYAGLMCVLPLADVQTIAVAGESQGQGLGTALLHRIIDSAADAGAEQLLLEVRADNDGAQSLYRREGFETIHSRPRYYGDGADALIMRKTLREPAAHSSASDLRS